MEDDDLDTVERMLEYLYTYDYDDGSSYNLVEESQNSEEQEVDKEDKIGSLRTSQSLTDPEGAEAETVQDALVSMEADDPLSVSGASEGNPAIEEPGLLNNVLVYAIAEKYHIPELKELAKTKFLSQANRLMSADSLMLSDTFPEVITTVYKSTPESDRGLRNIVSRICVKHVRTLIEKEAFKDVIRKIGDFGVDVLYGALKYDDGLLEQAQAEKIVLENELREDQPKILNVELDANRAKERLKRAIRLVNSHSSCRHCSAEFSGHFDEGDPAVLRCAKCRTRHM